MTTAAIIPVKNRLPLLKHTIQRLLYKNGVDYVICVGSNKDEQECCERWGAEWVYHPNDPLGMKWNEGWQFAMDTHDPDAYLFVGSSDWLSDNYLPRMLPWLNQFDIIGKYDMWLYDIGVNGGRLCYWPGYVGERAGDTIGIGRLLSRDIVKKMGGRPFQNNLDNSMDHSMMVHALSYGANCAVIPNREILSLSVSCHAWVNKHKFEEHWRGELPSENHSHGKEWMTKHFPEIYDVRL